MGLSWQQGPLSVGAIGRFLAPEPLPQRLLYIEPLRRRIRVGFGGAWIADTEQVLLLFEPGRYPVAYFPQTDISPEILERTEHTTRHPDLGLRLGTPPKRASNKRHVRHGNTSSCPPTQASCEGGSMKMSRAAITNLWTPRLRQAKQPPSRSRAHLRPVESQTQ